MAGLLVERVDDEGGAVRVWVRSRDAEAVCPDCSAVSSAVHSRYLRQPADLPVGGRPVSILLAVRRFFCPNPGCARRTFAEQFGDLIGRRRRRTSPAASESTVFDRVPFRTFADSRPGSARCFS